jgi:hypothetical protein
MTTSNTYGRGVWLPLTNKSGGSVAAGDVVVVDTTNNDAFTTSTAGAFTGGVGVVQSTSIANNAVGLVAFSGYVTLVNTSASVPRGNFGKTHTVAKQAVDAGATRGVGTFCQFLTGGTTPDALLYPVDLLGSSLTNPMTTKGDIIQGDTGGAAVRLGAGTAGQALVSGGAAAFSSWGTPLGVYGGGLVLLEQHAASASSSLDFATFISSTYDTYMFTFISIGPATSTAIFYMRMGTGGGPTYDTGANYGSQLLRHNNAAAAYSGSDSGANQIALTTAWLSAGNHPIAGSLELYDPQNASLYKWVSGKFVYPDSGISNMVVAEMGGQYDSATAVTAVRFFMSSGNITSGTIRVYGIAKA